MKVIYIKQKTAETEDGKQFELGFIGSLNSLIYKVTVKGDSENMGNFIRENKLEFYGQKIDLELKNKQKELSSFEEGKEEVAKERDREATEEEDKESGN